MQLRLITFNLLTLTGEQLIGFKIIPQKLISVYKKAIKKLEDLQCVFNIDNVDYTWNMLYFTISNISTMESKILNDIFDMLIEGGYSKNIGAIPDPVEQAYLLGLMNDDLLDEYAAYLDLLLDYYN